MTWHAAESRHLVMWHHSICHALRSAPFPGSRRHLAQKVVRGDYPIPANIPVSPTCLELLKGILVPNPKARMGMMDIKQHAWFLQDKQHRCCCKNDLCLGYISHFLVVLVSLYSAIPQHLVHVTMTLLCTACKHAASTGIGLKSVLSMICTSTATVTLP